MNLKAFWVQQRDDNWGIFVHAETAGKAKQVYLNSYPGLDAPEFIDIRAIRQPRLDYLPFCDEIMKALGYELAFEEAYDCEEWDNEHLKACPCETCNMERQKLDVDMY